MFDNNNMLRLTKFDDESVLINLLHDITFECFDNTVEYAIRVTARDEEKYELLVFLIDRRRIDIVHTINSIRKSREIKLIASFKKTRS